MAKIWQYNPWYRFARHYVDFCTRTSFSSLRIEGLENIPQKGAVMLAPNHRAALMDALMILLLKQEAIGFGARADIFRNPRIARILNWLRIVPIARERDGLKEVSANLVIYDEIVECMEHETPFCLFSEGTHRPERGMMPVKKGIFRIARMAMDKLGQSVYIVPVGLDYEDFKREMGRATIKVGQPIDLQAFMKEHEGLGDAQLYQLLCAELRTRILALIDNMPPRRKGLLPLRTLLALLSLPLFVVCAIASMPIWLTSKLILSKMEDKAWAHTVVYGCRFVLPIFWPFWWVYALLCNYYDHIVEDFNIA